MPDVELARRPGVELIRTGSWGALTGSWTPTREDILSAVKAQECPAVRRPRLKIGHTDPRFNTGGDGEPALGWFENLRAEDGGNTLLGDQVALPWLSSVQAAAYPDRSIEGNYRHVCALGHQHPFVITAVALLGVTPPAVSTLKSVQDLPEMLGVAASEDVPAGAEHVQVTIRATAAVHTGAMVALIPTAGDAQRLVVEGGEPADQLHVTLAYLGEAADLGAHGQQDAIDAVSSAVNGMPVIDADIFSAAVFNPGDASDREPCLVYGLSGDMLDAVHDMVDQALQGLDLPPQLRPFAAHMTAVYTGDLARLGDLAANVGPVEFDRVRLAFGGQVIDIPLIDDDEPAADGLEVPNILMPVAAASADSLREYWVHGPGARKIRWGEKNDFYRCVRQLKSHVADPKGLCNTYHREALGVAPGQEGVKAGAGNGAPPMTRAEKIRAAWNNTFPPDSRWVQEVRANAAIVVNDADRTYQLFPVTFDGDQVLFGSPEPYDPESDRPLVFASRAESRPEEPVAATGTTPEIPAPAVGPAPVLPAAEPEQVNPTDPKEDLVSTDLSVFRSRLGLDDTADEQAILAAIDALKAKAEAPVQPTPEMVAASAAAEDEKDELRKEVSVLASHGDRSAPSSPRRRPRRPPPSKPASSTPR
jgi:2'-5' RNA ligase